ncbi:30S ribosomal protein S1 [uncultured Fusobacterium sp.]|jgi:small subunit ribosomal protein S1|uniref:30S ribosomal protein S1 n=1 Tax=uncultured Fusobacterium sp. TaxID=159267 RepID=UPI0015A54D2C|nr:30S ribosomal protein S1 [uncultured Fusobacterium sp.]
MSNNNEHVDYTEFESWLNEYMPEEDNAKGEKVRVKGILATKERNFSFLDVPGLPTSVRVRTEELENYNEGDEVEVLLVGEDEDFKIGSRRRIDMEDSWKKLEEAFEKKEIITGKIVKRVKGGYMVEAMFHQGFLPNSLSEISMKDGDKVIGDEIKVMIKDIKPDKDKKGKKITFSKKDITLLKESEEFSELKVGDVVEAEITDVLEFGLSLKIQHLRGFVHISEVSWKKLDKLSDQYKKGDMVKAEIISLEPEKKNVKLSIKALTRNPWEVAAEQYAVDSVIEGKVTKILPYGVFVEIADGVEGLVHMSDFTWNKKRVSLNEFVQVGDTVKVKVLEFQPAERKLKLGIKQLSENPWDSAETRYAVGTQLKGKVLEVKPFGLFAEVEPGVDVFIHQSDYNWQGEENKKFAVGDTVEFKVIELNTEDNKIKGSIKALRKSPWEVALENYKVGDTVEKEIKNIMDFGLFVNLSKGIDGFIPAQLASKDFIKNLKDKFTVGQKVKAQITEIDREKQRIKLSIKKIEIEEERRENQELLSKYGTSGEDR